jgi:uncharacterized protein YbaP (TraB family)
MHLVPAGATIPDWVEFAYQWSEDLYLEADLADLLRHAVLPSGETAEREVPPELWANLKTLWPADHPSGSFGPQKLWLIVMWLGTHGVPFFLGVENYVSRRAITDARPPFKHLETGAEFAGLMDTIPSGECVRALTESLGSDVATRTQMIADMYEAWQSRRLDGLMEILQKSPLGRFPHVREIMFDRRNLLWLPRIIDIARTNRRTVIFVGAGHLGGSGGLPVLLRREGFECAPVP